jgi:hypothetical protein
MCHFDRSLSQLYRERRSGETRFSTEPGSIGREADSSTLLRFARNDIFDGPRMFAGLATCLASTDFYAPFRALPSSSLQGLK